MATNYLRLSQGPLRLPRSITAAQGTIRLFMAYLCQTPTQNAIRAIANGGLYKGVEAYSRELEDAIQTLLRVGIPRNYDDLCRLIAHTPALQTVCSFAWQANDPLNLPAQALIPREVIEACVVAYHDWVLALSKPRRS